MKKNILITGGNGFLGRFLVQALLERHETLLVYLLARHKRPRNISSMSLRRLTSPESKSFGVTLRFRISA